MSHSSALLAGSLTANLYQFVTSRPLVVESSWGSRRISFYNKEALYFSGANSLEVGSVNHLQMGIGPLPCVPATEASEHHYQALNLSFSWVGLHGFFRVLESGAKRKGRDSFFLAHLCVGFLFPGSVSRPPPPPFSCAPSQTLLHIQLVTHTHNFVTHTHAQRAHTHTHFVTHNLSHAIGHTHTHAHNFVTHSFVTHTIFLTQPLLQTLFATHTQLCHTHTIFHTQLCHTHLCHTHTTLSHIILHTQPCHTIFHTHTTLSHTSFTQNFVTHNFVAHIFVTHTQLCHTHLCHAQSFTHNCVSHR